MGKNIPGRSQFIKEVRLMRLKVMLRMELAGTSEVLRTYVCVE